MGEETSFSCWKENRLEVFTLNSLLPTNFLLWLAEVDETSTTYLFINIIAEPPITTKTRGIQSNECWAWDWLITTKGSFDPEFQ